MSHFDILVFGINQSLTAGKPSAKDAFEWDFFPEVYHSTDDPQDAIEMFDKTEDSVVMRQLYGGRDWWAEAYMILAYDVDEDGDMISSTADSFDRDDMERFRNLYC